MSHGTAARQVAIGTITTMFFSILVGVIITAKEPIPVLLMYSVLLLLAGLCIVARPDIGLLAFLLAFPFQEMSNISVGFTDLSVLEVFALILFGTMMLRKLVTDRHWNRANLTFPMLVFMGLVLLSFLRYPDFNMSARALGDLEYVSSFKALYWNTLGFMIFLVFANARWSVRTMRRVFWVMLGVFTFMGVVQGLSFLLSWSLQDLSGGFVWRAVFSSRRHQYAAWGGFAFSLALAGILLDQCKQRRRWYWLVVVFTVPMQLVLSTLSSLIGFLVASILLVFRLRHQVKFSFLVSRLGVLSVALAGFFWVASVTPSLNFASLPQIARKLDMDSTSMRGRLVAWTVGIDAIREHPLGIGLNRYPVYYWSHSLARPGIMGEGGIAPHSIFILVANDVGVIGLFVFFWLMYRALKMAIRSYERLDDQFLRVMLFGSWYALLVIFFTGITDQTWFYLPLRLLWMVLLGVIAASEKIIEDHARVSL